MINVESVKDYILSSELAPLMQTLYGDAFGQTGQAERWQRLAGLFARQFPQQQKVRIFSTPGRTEIGGNHTDHQHGRVLCASVDLDIIALAAPNKDNVIRLKSEGFPKMDVIDLANLEPVAAEKEHSASLIRGIAAGFARRGCPIGGFDAYTTSFVPKGSGLSSSAAFEILVATVLDELWNEGRLSPVERAIIGQFAENTYFGKPSGLMDQCGCSVGGFLTIDFARPADPLVEELDFDFAGTGHVLIITDTGGSHADLTADYASIPAEMGQVASFFGQEVLRQVDQGQFWQRLGEIHGQTSDRALLRAIHFFQENSRVKHQVQALTSGDFAGVLDLVKASGQCSRNKLQNIFAGRLPDQQPLSMALFLCKRILAGRGASRVHGGGFAGTIQAFVPLDLAADYLAGMQELFGPVAASQMQIRQIGSTELTAYAG